MRQLGSQRSTGGQRVYAEDAIDRVSLIQQLYAAGLPSSVIVTLLPCVVTGVATPEMITRMVGQRDVVVAKIAALSATRDRLDEIIAAVDAHANDRAAVA